MGTTTATVGYRVTISCSSGGADAIELTTENNRPDLQRVRFQMNTLDDNSRNLASAVRCEILMRGSITADNREITKQLALWSIDANPDTQYRNIIIEVYEHTNCRGNMLRRYEVEEVFVLDYKEAFGSVSEAGTYMLFLAQRERNSNREIYAK